MKAQTHIAVALPIIRVALIVCVCVFVYSLGLFGKQVYGVVPLPEDDDAFHAFAYTHTRTHTSLMSCAVTSFSTTGPGFRRRNHRCVICNTH